LTLKERGWPEAGDLVIATVKSITHYGAYVFLDEYEKEGLLHISEISSSWIRNVRDFVREGQKVVLKVLRVNEEKGQVDLSLRRVSARERREKLLSWKKDKKAESLLRSASERLKVPIEEIYVKAGEPIEKSLGLYKGLEKAAREGPEALLDLGVPKDIATILAEIAKEKIKMPTVRVKGILELKCTKPNGVTIIREALLSAQRIKKPQGTIVKVYAVAAPKYRIEALAENYKDAETVLKIAAETALKNITNAGGQGNFEREK
jgi:translation initiation factor 2 subunit 1